MTISTRARAVTAAAALATGALVLLGAPLAASAHVHVDPGSATAGAYATLTFTVPNESATASTTSVTLDLPQDTPFTSVSYQPVPGWTAEVTTATLPAPVTVGSATITEAPVSVTWTATDGVGIADGQFQEFPISAGPVPDTGSVLLPVHQAYSDGSVVDWDEATPESGEEPEHPAPTLSIGDADPEADTHAHGGAEASVTAQDAQTASSASTDEASATAFTALGVGIGGFVVGAAGLVVAAIALLRRPRSTPSNEGTR